MSTIQVDRIIPYQSASVTIEGDVIQANAATTGSNTFTGDQNIQGTITASIAEGFALVGGVGNISTLVATSSFIDALPSGVVSGSSQIDYTSISNIPADIVSGSSQVTPLLPTGVVSGSSQITYESISSIPSGIVSGSSQITDLGFANTNAANIFTQTQTITGSILQSGSLPNEFTRVQIARSNKAFYGTANTLLSLVGDSQGIIDFYADGGNYDTLNIVLTQNSGTTFRDYNGTTYSNWLKIPTNTGGNPAPQFQRGLEVTGSVDISSVLKLAGQDPLPAGAEGELAVSGSNLYFFSGSAWNQIN